MGDMTCTFYVWFRPSEWFHHIPHYCWQKCIISVLQNIWSICTFWRVGLLWWNENLVRNDCTISQSTCMMSTIVHHNSSSTLLKSNQIHEIPTLLLLYKGDQSSMIKVTEGEIWNILWTFCGSPVAKWSGVSRSRWRSWCNVLNNGLLHPFSVALGLYLIS